MQFQYSVPGKNKLPVSLTATMTTRDISLPFKMLESDTVKKECEEAGEEGRRPIEGREPQQCSLTLLSSKQFN